MRKSRFDFMPFTNRVREIRLVCSINLFHRNKCSIRIIFYCVFGIDLKKRWESAPLPCWRYLKRNFKRYFLIYADHLTVGELLIIGIVLTTVNDRFLLVLFYFPFLYESRLFCPDLFKQDRCRLVVRVLGNKFTLYSPLQYAVFKLLSCHSDAI